MEHLIAEREAHGPFVDLFDFCRRTDKRIVNRRAIETMIRAGAFDGLDDNRAKLLANVELAMSLAEQAAANINQGGLFDDFDDSVASAAGEMKDVPAWERSATPQAEEKLAIGFICPPSVLGPCRHGAPFCQNTLPACRPRKEPQTLAGVVTGAHQGGQSRQMARMCSWTTAPPSTMCLCSRKPEANRHKLREDALLIVEGKVSYDDFSGGLRIVVDSVLELAEAQSRFCPRPGAEPARRERYRQAKHLLQPFAGSGPCPPALSLCWQPTRGEAGRLARRGM